MTQPVKPLSGGSNQFCHIHTALHANRFTALSSRHLCKCQSSENIIFCFTGAFSLIVIQYGTLPVGAKHVLFESPGYAACFEKCVIARGPRERKPSLFFFSLIPHKKAPPRLSRAKHMLLRLKSIEFIQASVLQGKYTRRFCSFSISQL